MKKHHVWFLALWSTIALHAQDPNLDLGNDASNKFPINLETTLRLVQANNPQIALAQERVREARSKWREKRYLLLPDIAIGASWFQQDGLLQATDGSVIDVKRRSSFQGAGAGSIGAGPLMVPGVTISANVADVLFAPLVAKQNHLAVKAASEATKQHVEFQAVAAYFELLRAGALVVIAEETLSNTEELARVTGDFSASGEGLESDAQRAKVEQMFRQRDREKARENLATQGAALARLLHLTADLELVPENSEIFPITLLETTNDVSKYIADALSSRPELRGGQAHVASAKQALRQSRFGLVAPNLGVGVSSGRTRGGIGNDLGSSSSRTDVSAMVFWRWQGLGFSEREQIVQRRSQLSQAQHAQDGAIDQIIAEVKQGHAQVNSRRKQINIAEQAVSSATASFEQNRSRIFERQGLPIEVLEAIQSLARARELYVDTVTEYNQAQFQFQAAIGATTETRR